jgi:hypothetical protein
LDRSAILTFFTDITKLLEIGRGSLSVGKIYGGILIMENWKQTRFGQEIQPAFQVQVRFQLAFSRYIV